MQSINHTVPYPRPVRYGTVSYRTIHLVPYIWHGTRGVPFPRIPARDTRNSIGIPGLPDSCGIPSIFPNS